MAFPLLPVRILHADPALGRVRAIAPSLEGAVIWAGADAGVLLEVGRGGPLIRRIHAHKGGVTCLAVSKGILVTGGNDGRVRVWSSESLECLSQWEAPGKRAHAVRIDPSRGTVWSLGRNGWSAEWSLGGVATRPPCDEGSEARRDLEDEVGAVTFGDLCVRTVGRRAEGWSREGKVWEVDLPGFKWAEAMAGIGEVVWIAGRNQDRMVLLARVLCADPTKARTAFLPYGATSLATAGEANVLIAGGAGRIFAIDVPAV